MVVLALVLLLLALGFSVAIVVSNSELYTLSLLGAQIPVNLPGVFFTGAGTMLVAVLALLLLRSGMRRARARRKRLKELKATGGQPAVSGRAAVAKSAPAESASARPGTSGPATTGPATTGLGAAGAGAAGAGATGAGATGAGATGAGATGAGATGPATASGREIGPKPLTTSAERQAMLDEADRLSREEPKG